MKEELIKFLEKEEILGYRLDGPSEHILREALDKFFNQYQPERSKREDSCFICTSCENHFDPSDWENDICDKCLYKRRDAVL